MTPKFYIENLLRDKKNHEPNSYKNFHYKKQAMSTRFYLIQVH